MVFNTIYRVAGRPRTRDAMRQSPCWRKIAYGNEERIFLEMAVWLDIIALPGHIASIDR